MFRFGDPGGRVYGSLGTANVNLLSYWTNALVSGNSWSLVAAGGRTTGSCLRIVGNYNNNTYLSKSLDSQGTWGAAFAVRPAAPVAGTTASVGLVGFFDSGTIQADLRINPDLSLQFTRNGTLIGPPSPIILPPGVWSHVEVKVVIHPTAGSVECRVNGVARIGPTGSLNTRNSANSTANTVAIGNTSGNAWTTTTAIWDLDDIIIWDGQATDANGFADINNFIGDCGLTWLLPSGAGTTTQFTPDSAVANYTRVADATVDTTSYVESPTVNNLDLYALTDAGTNISAIKSFQIVDYGRKTDVGSRGARAVLRTGGGNFTHPSEMVLSDSYVYFSNGWGLNPGTGLAWTVADINALEIGQKVSS